MLPADRLHGPGAIVDKPTARPSFSAARPSWSQSCRPKHARCSRPAGLVQGDAAKNLQPVARGGRPDRQTVPTVHRRDDHGFLIPLATDLKIRERRIQLGLDHARRRHPGYTHSPIDFHDQPSRRRTSFHDDDRYGHQVQQFLDHPDPARLFALLFMHPINRPDLPFGRSPGSWTAILFSDSLLNFPAHWHDAGFNGVLPRGHAGRAMPCRSSPAGGLEPPISWKRGLVGEAWRRVTQPPPRARGH